MKKEIHIDLLNKQKQRTNENVNQLSNQRK
jgi:hypothetical protein